LQEARAARRRAHHKSAPESAKARALQENLCAEDQRAAFEHAVAEGGLKIIEGRRHRKSFTLAAIRDAHMQAQGRGVIGSRRQQRRGR